MSTTGDRTSEASGMTEQQALGLLGGEVREGYAEIGDVRVAHYWGDADQVLPRKQRHPSRRTRPSARGRRSVADHTAYLIH